MVRNIFLVLLICIFFSNIGNCENRKVSLQEAITQAIEKNGEIKEEIYNVEKAQLNTELVETKYYPKLEIMAGVGPINKAYGDALNSENSDVKEISNWRALYLVSGKGSYPLYTWGQKSDFLNAAKLNTIVTKDGVLLKKNQIAFKIKEIYYSKLLATNLLDFINSGLEDVQAVSEKVQKNKDEFLRLQIFENLLKSKQAELKNQVELSLKALNYYLDDEKVEIKEDWLELNLRKIAPLEKYLEILSSDAPELNQINNGIMANEYLAKATKKNNYPVLGILLKYEYSHTDARQIQDSVFAYDPYNENSLVIGLGFQWKFDFGVTNVEASQFSVESLKLKTKQDYAKRGIKLIVEKNWNDIISIEEQLKSSEEAAKIAKKLLNRALIGGTIGLIKAKDVVDAYEARVLSLKEHFQNIFNYNLAWANLSLAVGREVDPLIENL